MAKARETNPPAANVKAIVPEDLPPARRLDADCTITSRADVDDAMGELAWMNSRHKTVKAQAAQRIALINAETQQKLIIDVDGKPVAFADRAAQLDEAIRDYAKKNPKELFTDGKKSCEMTHGSIATRKVPLHIDFLARQKPDTVLANLAELSEQPDGLKQYAESALRDLVPFEDSEVTTDQLVTVEVKLSKSQALALYKDKQLTKVHLKQIGLKAATGNTIKVEPREPIIQSEPAAAVAAGVKKSKS